MSQEQPLFVHKVETPRKGREQYPRKKLKVLSLIGDEVKPYLQRLWEWLLTFRPYTNWGETGHTVDGLVGWMFFHNFLLVDQPKSKYGSAVLVDFTTGDHLGVASLVPDDRGVAKEMEDTFAVKPTGFWGGVYIKDVLHGAGLGSYLCGKLDDEIQTRVNETGQEEDWYLLTRNPAAIAIYVALGFEKFREDWHIKTFDVHETVFRKTYRRAP